MIINISSPIYLIFYFFLIFQLKIQLIKKIGFYQLKKRIEAIINVFKLFLLEIRNVKRNQFGNDIVDQIL